MTSGPETECRFRLNSGYGLFLTVRLSPNATKPRAAVPEASLRPFAAPDGEPSGLITTLERVGYQEINVLALNGRV